MTVGTVAVMPHVAIGYWLDLLVHSTHSQVESDIAILVLGTREQRYYTYMGTFTLTAQLKGTKLAQRKVQTVQYCTDSLTTRMYLQYCMLPSINRLSSP